MLFDTTFFVDLADELAARQQGPCVTFLRAHRSAPKRVSVITIGEYAVGAGVRETLRIFRGYQPMALGVDTAIAAGRLQASLPMELGENDLWIAATAMRFGLSLVTRDKAFGRIPGLKVVRY